MMFLKKGINSSVLVRAEGKFSTLNLIERCLLLFKIQTFPVTIASHFSPLSESSTWPIIHENVLPENYSNTVADKNVYGLFLYKGSRDH